MTETSKRSDWFGLLTTRVRLAALLALSVLACGLHIRPAYAQAAETTLTTAPDAASEASHAVPTAPTRADMEQSQLLAKRFISSAANLPVSFVLDGKTIRGIPSAWNPTANQRRLDAHRSETVYEGVEPKTGLRLRVECTQYDDYPVIEWVAWFTNQGQADTPILSDILALDGTFPGSGASLYSNNGDFYSKTGYTPQIRPIPAGTSFRFAPNGGRPSDGAFPYYRLTFNNWGLSLAIGWPAQWAARFDGRSGGVRVRAGQEKTHLRLHPGEKIRTPRITLLSWSGDASRAVNLWRRWYFAHIMPRPGGQPHKPLLAVAGTDEGDEFTAATEANQIRYLDKYVRLGFKFDVWWIDAGWYPCRGVWTDTGTWKPDPARFPHGMKSISDDAERNGAKLLVWFEPERVRPDSELSDEHSSWLLRIKGDDNSLLNLGNPESRQWLTDRVCQLIRDNGIKIYRQDFNFASLEFWRKNDAPDRRGMNENLHVQGYLQYWDDLLARNPGLWIDSCSSGGRRNDLETMRRAVPLHYSDYGYGYHAVKLSFHQTMFEWLPYFKETTLSWDLTKPARFNNQVDSFSYHCAMAPMLALGFDIRRDDYDYALAKKMIAIWRRAADLILYGDYYPHTAFSRTPDKWVAWQSDSPEEGRGLIQGIRLPACKQETLTIHPRGIDPNAAYLFENDESRESRSVAGKDLIRTGFTFALPKRSGAIWFYRRVASASH